MLAKQEVIIVTETITDGELLNQHLEKDIRDAGYGSKLTTAKCYRTRWNMHETSNAFALLGQGAISVAKRFYTDEYDENGNRKDYNLRVSESWGLIYRIYNSMRLLMIIAMSILINLINIFNEKFNQNQINHESLKRSGPLRLTLENLREASKR